MSCLVQLSAVEKRYPDVAALKGLSLTLQAGEVLALLGHNGAGKSTAIKLILGLIPVSAGQVHVFGQDPRGKHSRALRQRIGYLPENVSFYEQLSAREVLNYFSRLKRVKKAETESALQQVGLLEVAHRRLKTYSKGMRQRLGLAQALLAQPRLLLLDEPTVGLDPLATQAFYNTLDRLRAAGVGIILCSHVLTDIEAHVDRIAILGDGRLLALGSAAQLRAQSNLAHQIQVRAHCSPETWQPLLEHLGITHYHVDGDCLQLQCPAQEKLTVIRALMQQSTLYDLDSAGPSLQAVYQQINTPADAAQAAL